MGYPLRMGLESGIWSAKQCYQHQLEKGMEFYQQKHMHFRDIW